ncbi:hypothetical protein BGW36DRAFT_353425 [Talaromyces proteolyticus]|uniref:Uncharacterized protein n=1 Tax=Talaromyces proteolyticus TaxID=1131652 RepID=A0AAD4Q0X6_9EURO|nr:uncharacterized protein BGW36DRAFT_353425 [Talaromyces proteolyticus]KAH8704995.1 hypothetical protein BGW36DRAFT_353425 [Talaromyces proteolyticus]
MSGMLTANAVAAPATNRYGLAAASGSGGGRKPNREGGDRPNPRQGGVRKNKGRKWCVLWRRPGHNHEECALRRIVDVVGAALNQGNLDMNDLPVQHPPNAQARRSERRRLRREQEQLEAQEPKQEEDEEEIKLEEEKPEPPVRANARTRRSERRRLEYVRRMRENEQQRLDNEILQGYEDLMQLFRNLSISLPDSMEGIKEGSKEH